MSIDRFCVSFILLLTGFASALAANTPPVAAPDAVETHARQAVLIDLLANDGDADGDPLTVSITTGPAFGSLVDHGDGTVTYTPDPVLFEGAGGDGFSYTASDGRGGSAGAAVTVDEIPVPSEAQPVPAPTVLLNDNFDDGDFAGWTPVDFGSGSSNWTVVDGELVQTSNICCDGRGRGTYAVYDGGTTWDDYRFQATIRSADDDAIGLVFRYQDGDNHYRFDWRRQQNLRRLMKVQGGTSIVIQQDSIPYRRSVDHRLDIRALGTSLEVLIDGEVIFSAQDTSFSSGTVALLSHGNAGSYFDDIVVSELPEAAAPVLLEEDFNAFDFTGWTVEDWGQLSMPSSWSAATGALVQSSNIFSADKEGLFGTHVIYEDGRSWTDYRIALQLWSADNDSFGVLFRYQDDENFYRFNWNQEVAVRNLVKVENGVKTFLAQDSVAYQSNEIYYVEIVARGPDLELWIDGEQIFTVVDDALKSGTIGFTNEGNEGSHFDILRVTAIP